MKRFFHTILAVFLALIMGAAAVSSAFAAIPQEEAIAQANAYQKHSIGLKGVKNARELGGYKTGDGRTVKFGKLLRTGKLVNATEADRKKLVETYHLKKNIDFRSSGEIEDAPDPELPGVAYYNYSALGSTFQAYVPVVDGRTEEGLAYTLAFAKTILELDRNGDFFDTYYKAEYTQLYTTEAGIDSYREFFHQLLAANGDTVLWHCSAGKDRTGNAAMLLLIALGVDKETAIQDYLLTNDYVAADKKAAYDKYYEKTHNEKIAQDFASDPGVKRAWIEESFKTIEKYYGSVNGYLHKALGLTDDDIAKLRAAYTE